MQATPCVPAHGHTGEVNEVSETGKNALDPCRRRRVVRGRGPRTGDLHDRLRVAAVYVGRRERAAGSNSPTKGVIEPTPGGSPAAFGAQLLALRTRNVDLFGVSNHLFSATIDPAGETGSTVGGVAVAQPANHFAASFYYRTPATPVVSTRADGRFAELNPSSKGAGAEDVANRYAQVRVVNVNNTGNLRFEIGWYTSTSFTFCVQTAAQNLTWGAWFTNGRGLALFRTASAANFTIANRLDAVGSVCETNALFKEGAGHAVLDSGASSAEHT